MRLLETTEELPRWDVVVVLVGVMILERRIALARILPHELWTLHGEEASIQRHRLPVQICDLLLDDCTSWRLRLASATPI